MPVLSPVSVLPSHLRSMTVMKKTETEKQGRRAFICRVEGKTNRFLLDSFFYPSVTVTDRKKIVRHWTQFLFSNFSCSVSDSCVLPSLWLPRQVLTLHTDTSCLDLHSLWLPPDTHFKEGLNYKRKLLTEDTVCQQLDMMTQPEQNFPRNKKTKKEAEEGRHQLNSKPRKGSFPKKTSHKKPKEGKRKKRTKTDKDSINLVITWNTTHFILQEEKKGKSKSVGREKEEDTFLLRLMLE